MICRHTTRFASPIHAGFAIIVSFALLSTACAHHGSQAPSAKTPASLKRTSTSQKKSSESQKKSAIIASSEDEVGLASWYGDPYHGRRAASGEIFDKEKLTAAHRTLPFQTCVVVTNLTNGRTVKVRITDRGPFVDGRIIDLSEAAAREIDMVRAGVAQVSLHVTRADAVARKSPVVSTEARADFPKPASAADFSNAPSRYSISEPASPSPSSSSSSATAAAVYAVQAGSFLDRAHAEALAASVSKMIGAVRVRPEGSGAISWRVIVGRRMTLEEAGALAARIAEISGSASVVVDPFTAESD